MAATSRIGWPLLPLPDQAGRLNWPDLATSIHQQIRILLSTRPGEQLMHPAFGAGLSDLIGLPDSTSTRRQIEERITDALTLWETRILLEGVDVLDDPAQPGSLRVEIRFRVRRTGTPSRLGLSLALQKTDS